MKISNQVKKEEVNTLTQRHNKSHLQRHYNCKRYGHYKFKGETRISIRKIF